MTPMCTGLLWVGHIPLVHQVHITDLNLLKHWTPAINYGTPLSKGGPPVGLII